MDSLLTTIIRKYNLYRDLEYAILINSIEVSFQRDKFVPLYTEKETLRSYRPGSSTKDGIHLGGTCREFIPATWQAVSPSTVA